MTSQKHEGPETDDSTYEITGGYCPICPLDEAFEGSLFSYNEVSMESLIAQRTFHYFKQLMWAVRL